MGRLYDRIADIVERRILSGCDGARKFFDERVREQGYKGPKTIILNGCSFLGIRECTAQYLENKRFKVTYSEKSDNPNNCQYVINIREFFGPVIKSEIRDRKLARKNLKKISLNSDNILAESLN